MNCEETEELLAAYAIGALSTDEAAPVRAHLSTCRRHDKSLGGLRATVDSLALAAPEREPAAALRGRILSALSAETTPPQGPVVVPMRRAGARRIAAQQPAFAWAVAAVLLLGVVGLGAWNAVLQLGGGDEGLVSVQLSGDAGRGELVYLEDLGIAVFSVDLSEPLPGREYQAWGLSDTGPVSLGLLPADGAMALPADLSDATAVAVTVEPKGGSDQPTTDPVLVANLR